jgi:hypothetical protein
MHPIWKHNVSQSTTWKHNVSESTRRLQVTVDAARVYPHPIPASLARRVAWTRLATWSLLKISLM